MIQYKHAKLVLCTTQASSLYDIPSLKDLQSMEQVSVSTDFERRHSLALQMFGAFMKIVWDYSIGSQVLRL